MKNILGLLVFISTPVVAQFEKYFDDEISISSGPYGLIVIFTVIFLVLLLGTKDARFVLVKIVAFFASAASYIYVLITLGNYLQSSLSPIRHGVGIFTLLTLAIGCFGPLWWFYKRK